VRIVRADLRKEFFAAWDHARIRDDTGAHVNAQRHPAEALRAHNSHDTLSVRLFMFRRQCWRRGGAVSMGERNSPEFNVGRVAFGHVPQCKAQE
jgi:hypothetical protein